MAKEREVNTVNYSPLRYPGGKSRLAPFISLLIQKSKIETPIYVGGQVLRYLCYSTLP